jgi:hypothetical protein
MAYLRLSPHVSGSGTHWRRRRRWVIQALQKEGYIAQVGPAGQILWRQHVGEKEAWYWWRQQERGSRAWLLTLLLAGGLALAVHQLPAHERTPLALALVAPPLVHALTGLVRHIRR